MPLFQEKWTIFLDGLKKDRWSRSTGFIFCGRRLVLFCIIFFLINNGPLQIIAFSLRNSILLAVIGTIEGRVSRKENIIEVLDEFFLCLNCSLLPIYTDFVLEPATRYFLGWNQCGLIGLYITIGLLKQIYSFIKYLVHKYKIYRNKRKVTKKRRE